MPIDMEIFPRLTDKHTWACAARRHGAGDRCAVWRLRQGKNGEWSFHMELFEVYLARAGHRLAAAGTGKLNLRRKTFETMSKGWPQLEELRQLRHARDKMRKIKLAVGSDGRNRTVLWPFQSKTSRTQPKASHWIFSPAVWLRSLIKPGPGQAVAYIDYSSMEFLMAAALSDGCQYRCSTLYASGDPYLSFAKRVGAAPHRRPRIARAAARALQSCAARDSVRHEGGNAGGAARLSSFEAHEMLSQHHDLFASTGVGPTTGSRTRSTVGVMRTVV